MLVYCWRKCGVSADYTKLSECQRRLDAVKYDGCYGDVQASWCISADVVLAQCISLPEGEWWDPARRRHNMAGLHWLHLSWAFKSP